jgi:hypothetical protein
LIIVFLPALITETIGDWASGDCADLVFLAGDGSWGRAALAIAKQVLYKF